MAKARGILMAGNWKMNHTQKETEAFFAQLREKTDQYLSTPEKDLFTSEELRACLMPPMLSLMKAQACVSQLSFPLSIAAQNAHGETKGAFTGEVSSSMLNELQVQWVLLGHSERRQYFGETDASIRVKAESLLKQGFQVMICLGETLSERKSGKTMEVLKNQLSGILPSPSEGIASELSTSPSTGPGHSRVSFAYEPVWAIGTGLTATPEEAEEVHQMIREWLSMQISPKAATAPILYGGSVTPQNADSLLSCPNIDGALVGGASLKPESFLELLSISAKVLLRS